MTKYIITAIITILCVYIVVTQISYNKLKREIETLKLNDVSVSDSLSKENTILLYRIETLEDSVAVFQYKIDSLKQIKKTIIISKPFEESKNLSDGVEKLKRNLQCEKY